MTMMKMAAIGIAALTMTACQSDGDKADLGESTPGGRSATAMLRTAAGVDVGRATATEVGGGLRFTIDARGMPAGMHGAHVHMVGRCDAPDFASAGGHWNPTSMQHGTMNPQGPHTGDMPNLIVGTDGRGTLGVTVPGATMAGLLDADGSALVIHANPDDLKTDPSGNSGGRIACGVLTAN
ncbi:superoxide dismutase [Sphingomonas sp. Leaf339]|uniref:superoxide dismutase family protein n=1 Tax=Sphingomonas sp. Leaf339 TaxID=1736343 RepID=UPI000700EEC7|nr:superoxide dismutase family protein [Sphingomonas sp. Leaf339]KQU49852.1 superoxide dismutase [Sphingomonas sp. Leaf339]